MSCTEIIPLRRVKVLVKTLNIFIELQALYELNTMSSTQFECYHISYMSIIYL